MSRRMEAIAALFTLTTAVTSPGLALAGEQSESNTTSQTSGSESEHLDIPPGYLESGVEYSTFMEIVRKQINYEAEPDFFNKMEQRLISNPEEHFIKMFDPANIPEMRGHWLMYIPEIDKDVEDVKKYTPALAVFINEPPNGIVGQTQALVILQFNEFGTLGEREESYLESFIMDVEKLKELSDKYYKPENLEGMGWEDGFDLFGRYFSLRGNPNGQNQRVIPEGFTTYTTRYVPDASKIGPVSIPGKSFNS